MFDRLFKQKQTVAAPPQALQVGARAVPLLFVHHPRARRYLLRLRPDGTARVTIPRRGTISAGLDFAARNVGWLEQQLQTLADRPKAPAAWSVGTGLLFRGETVIIEADTPGWVRLGTERIPVSMAATDLRPALQKHLHRLAAREFPVRVVELATQHQISVTRVSVRNQKSRWGSCSRRGTISLNWRLIQMPAGVRDYVILHELAHRRQMNHSAQFWREVALLCPDYLQAKQWVNRHAHLLR